MRGIVKRKNYVDDEKYISKNKIISIGRLTKQKNYIFLLEALKNSKFKKRP